MDLNLGGQLAFDHRWVARHRTRGGRSPRRGGCNLVLVSRFLIFDQQ
jgi:hypothetical protein